MLIPVRTDDPRLGLRPQYLDVPVESIEALRPVDESTSLLDLGSEGSLTVYNPLVIERILSLGLRRES